MAAMNSQEATQLLALIKLSYPTAYRDMDDISKKATVKMWASSFPDVPYPIMEQAFNHFRMVSKFPPTVAEMVEELKSIHNIALERALLCRSIGNEDGIKQYQAIMNYTHAYKDMDNFWGRFDTFEIGGVNDVQRLGTPGNYDGTQNRLPLLETGES
jgi:hypothetical protein